jgi:hypothetical protein
MHQDPDGDNFATIEWREPRPVRIRELVANDIRGTPAGTWVTRDAVVLNLAILCVAMAALAVIELVLL